MKIRILVLVAAVAAGIAPVCAAVLQAFKPLGATVLVSATTSAQSVSLNGGGSSVRVYSACTVPVRVEFGGGSAVTPTVGVTGSLAVAANSVQVFEVGALVASVSVKVDSGTACNVEFTRGDGIL